MNNTVLVCVDAEDCHLLNALWDVIDNCKQMLFGEITASSAEEDRQTKTQINPVLSRS